MNDITIYLMKLIRLKTDRCDVVGQSLMRVRK